MDNFFTSMKLAQSLLEMKTTVLGTMNKQRREMPPSARNQKAELCSTTLMRSSEATLTIYQSKPNKNVVILSTMHPTILIGTDAKRKPESVTDYNSTKWGVDILDQMARYHTVKVATRRWPVAVFYNMLDLAAINAYVLYKQCMNNPRLTRRKFLTDLAFQLRQDHMAERNLPRTPRSAQQGPAPQVI